MSPLYIYSARKSFGWNFFTSRLIKFSRVQQFIRIPYTPITPCNIELHTEVIHILCYEISVQVTECNLYHFCSVEIEWSVSHDFIYVRIYYYNIRLPDNITLFIVCCRYIQWPIGQFYFRIRNRFYFTNIK